MITVVSGLPRSGTSLLMQMLEAGGLEILTDKLRVADHSNPKGYYEYEKVKGLIRDNSWLDDAENKVIKVVAPLVPHLNTDFSYKIVFMQRDIKEILRSQQVMLGKTGTAADAFPAALGNAFTKHVEQAEAWITQHSNAEAIYIPHRDVINEPLVQAEKVNSFLGGHLKVEAMTSVVDPDLYRNRIETN